MKKLLLFWQIIIAIIFASCSDKNGANNEITIYGNVIDRTTGHPLYNVLIQEKNKVGGSTVTGNDGNYEFTLPLSGSSDGKYFLIASKDQYVSSEYELVMTDIDKNRHIKVDFQLTPGYITYIGHVVDEDNNPVSNALVEENKNMLGSTFTDFNGDYKLQVTPVEHKGYTGWYNNLHVRKTGYSFYTNKQIFHTDADIGRTFTVDFIIYKE